LQLSSFAYLCVIKFYIMSFFKKHRNIIPFVVATLLITYLMPREGKFQYEFQKGKVWQHSTLTAPFDFPIYKSEDELAEERKHVLATLTPFYRRDSNVVRAQVAELNLTFRTSLNKSLNHYSDGVNLTEYNFLLYRVLPKLLQQLEFIYGKGVREPNSVAEGYLSSEHATLVVQDGRLSEVVSSQESFTPQSAYQFLSNNLHSLWADGSKEHKFFTKLDVQSFLKPNLMFDERLTAQSRQQRLAGIAPTKGMVNAGQQIIMQDEVVNANAYLVLSSLRQEYEQRVGYAGNQWLLLLGQLLLVLFFMTTLYIYIYMLGGESLVSFKRNTFLMLLIVSFFVLTLWITKTNIANVYVIPFAIIPVFVSTFFDSRLALFTHYIMAMLAAFMVPNSFEFFMLTCVAGTAAVYSMRHVYRRSKLYQTMAIVFAIYCLLYMALTLVKDGSISIAWRSYLWFGINAGLMLASYQLV